MSQDQPSEEQIQTLLNLADQLKQQGNLRLKENDRKAAFDLYTQGIEAARACGDVGKLTLSQLLSNRAHVRMQMDSDFVGAIEDCRAAVAADAKNVKAFWRAARASMSLELFKQATDFATDALNLDPTNPDLKELHFNCSSRLETYLARKTVRSFSKEEAEGAQERLMEASEKAAIAQSQVAAAENEKQRITKTISVLESLEGERIFTPLGKAFGLADAAQVHAQFKKTLETSGDRMVDLVGARDEMENRRRKAELEWKEVVAFLQRKT